MDTLVPKSYQAGSPAIVDPVIEISELAEVVVRLIAATSNAAKLIGEEERGTIEKGKIADLVLLDANP
jgi:cytosine/adenosine deaminase-related metal-dependent hydrolase